MRFLAGTLSDSRQNEAAITNVKKTEGAFRAKKSSLNGDAERAASFKVNECHWWIRS